MASDDPNSVPAVDGFHVVVEGVTVHVTFDKRDFPLPLASSPRSHAILDYLMLDVAPKLKTLATPAV